MRRSRLMGLSAVALLLAICLPATPAVGIEQNAVTEWALIVQPAIHNATEARGAGSSYILQTTIQLAVYDAVMAIEGGYEPFHTPVKAAKDADVRTAVATAAYRTARGRVAPSQFGYLDDRYGAYMAPLPDGAAKQHGIEAGEAAAAGILARRVADGFNNTVTYQCSATPPPVGEFEPDGGCATQPIETKLAQVVPFTYPDPAQFRPDGPDPSASHQFAADFDEVKTYGRADSTVRTPEQTDIAYFWSENPYVHWNRNLTNLAVVKGLGVAETARMLAMTWTAMSDTLIAGFEAKYHFRYWRPRTAIPRAAEDDNPKTIPDPTWTPLLKVNHPEYPSAHAFVVVGIIEALTAFFGTDQVEWTLETSKAAVPKLAQTQRTFPNLKEIVAQLTNSRVWAGLHYRNSMTEGVALGTRVGQLAMKDRFGPLPASPPPAAPLPTEQTVLPRTGSAPVSGLLAALGLGLTAAGATTRALARRRRVPVGVTRGFHLQLHSR